MRNHLKIAVLLLAVVLGYSTLVEPDWIQTTEVEIREEPFSSFFQKHKTIFISDVHVSRGGGREQKLLRLIEQIDPDIILVGGDCTPWDGDYERTFAFLGKLKAREGIWGVLGDSDYQNSRKSCRFCHAFNTGESPLPVRFLQNQAFKPDAEGLAIAGLDIFPIDAEHRRKARESLLNGPALLITQKQPRLEELPDHPLLVLSGDTHAGQAWMPDWLWERAFSRTKGEVRYGLKREGQRTLFVSSGVGVNKLPFRLMAPPEIVVLRGKGFETKKPEEPERGAP